MTDTATTTVIEVLQKARALIEREENWGQGFIGRRPGTMCAGQAIENVPASSDLNDEAWFALALTVRAQVTDFNDTHTHAEVLAAFDKAIAAEQAKAGAA